MNRLTSFGPAGCYLALFSLAACGGSIDSKNLGDTAEDGSVAPRPMTDFVGTWVGEIEDPLGPRSGGQPAVYRFPSGSTQVRFEFPEPPSAFLSPAYLTFGAGEAPPWPAALDTSYPPGVDYTALWYSTYLPPTEGYAYDLTILDRFPDSLPRPELLPDGVLRLGYLANEAISRWCEAQPPVPTADGYSCLGGNPGGYTSANGSSPPLECYVDDTTVDCGKYFLCVGGARVQGSSVGSPPCTCSESGCGIDFGTPSDLLLSRDGDDLIGVLGSSAFLRPSGELTILGQVRFHRE